MLHVELLCIFFDRGLGGINITMQSCLTSFFSSLWSWFQALSAFKLSNLFSCHISNNIFMVFFVSLFRSKCAHVNYCTHLFMLLDFSNASSLSFLFECNIWRWNPLYIFSKQNTNNSSWFAMHFCNKEYSTKSSQKVVHSSKFGLLLW